MSIQVNILNSWLRLWGSFHQKNHETQFLINPMLKDGIELKIQF
jgi:hypothetical protein